MLFGAHFKAIDQILPGTVSIAGMTLQSQELLAIVLAPVLLGGLAIFLTRHKVGLAIRAIAQNW